MSLYESNYLRLARLVPDLDFPFDSAVSRSELDLPLYLSVLERSRYTADIRLTYHFQDEGCQLVYEPDVHMRIYRDAGLAEAFRLGPSSHVNVLNGLFDFDFETGGHLQRRWARNLVLNKWLTFCLNRGHGFTTAGRPRLGAASE
jgi:uncharacterized protein YqiB (DUF1249 family)